MTENKAIATRIARATALGHFFCYPAPTWAQAMEELESRIDIGDRWEAVGSLLFAGPSEDDSIPEVTIWGPFTGMTNQEFASAIKSLAYSIEDAIMQYDDQRIRDLR